LGLTGLVVEAELQLRPVQSTWLNSETQRFSDLSGFFHWADQSQADWEYTVSWIDCLSPKGKGVFFRANHAATALPEPHAKPAKTFPLSPPFSLVNRFSLRAFNLAYMAAQALKPTRSVVHHQPFFYPLDAMLGWNKLYGPQGFYQYQSVVPTAAGLEATRSMLKAISRSGQGSFLAVLKTMGDLASPGMLSFPMPGVTLALDFPNQGERTLKLLNELDAIVREANGRVYMAKDARMPKDLFESGYPQHAAFAKFRDPAMSSDMSRRLLGA
jgi:FAD/FMN-containing dehydrogenase